jgi:hypothetical protein
MGEESGSAGGTLGFAYVEELATDNLASSMDQKISIYLEQTDETERRVEPVRIGVPLEKGFARDACVLRLKNNLGEEIPLQSRPLAVWPDGTIKWVLLDFIASVSGLKRTAYKLDRCAEEDCGRPEIAEGFLLREEDECLVVDTGAAQFHVSRRHFEPFRTVSIGDCRIVSDEGSRARITDKDGRIYVPEVDTLVEEEKGPVRLTLRIDGRFVSGQRKFLCLFKSRLTFYHGLSLVKVDFQIHNPRAAIHPGGRWDLGDPGSIHFRDLSLVLHASESPRAISWMAESRTGISNQQESAWLLYQDSSGGDHWDSRNHIDKDGNISVSFRGYRIAPSNEELKSPIASGNRATPYVQMNTSSGWMAATVLDFWQNFPKALQVNGKELRIALFPGECSAGFELQGGEKKRHSILVDFGAGEDQTTIAHLQQPLSVSLDPGWVERSGAISYFVSQCEDNNRTYTNYIKNIIDGSESFFRKRESVDEFGWRNFGELYGDHEAVNHKGPYPLVSHYNNQYDFIYAALVHFLRTGDQGWYELMDKAARHTIDIDIYHTDEDKPAYNHGLFWHTDHYRDAGTATHRTYSRKNGGGGSYGGGPSNEHNYTSGLLSYFYLTGDVEAADAVLELAGWVIRMDDGSRTLLGLIDGGPSGMASQTVSPLYHKPGRGAGNSINALIDAYRLSDERHYMTKAEELIQRCIHPEDDINALKLDQPEFRWSYLVFLQVLGKYVEVKLELGETDYLFFYARDSLLHYADWMVNNETPYKNVLHKVEIPTETWPAHDIRKCHILHLAGKYGCPERRLVYQEKARFFFEHCLTDLLSFGTSSLTRPLVILAAYGYVHPYFEQYGTSYTDFPRHAHSFGMALGFLPQKARIKNILLEKFRTLVKELKRVSSGKWYELKEKIVCRI